MTGDVVEISRLIPVVREGRGGYEGISESGETEDQSEHVSLCGGWGIEEAREVEGVYFVDVCYHASLGRSSIVSSQGDAGFY